MIARQKKSISYWFRAHSNLIAGLVAVLGPFILLAPLLLGPTLAFGDIPLVDPAVSRPNFLYVWGTESFGTNVRQGLFSLRNAFLYPISINAHGAYILTFLLPLLLIPATYYFFLGKCGVSSKPVRLLASLFALANPVVFGDFSKAQTFWIYLTVPWALYYTLQIFYWLDVRWRNFIGLAFWLFLSFGLLPPIIMVMLLINGMVAFCLFVMRFKDVLLQKHLLRQLIIRTGVSIILFAIMALPYVLIAPAGQAAFKPVSLLGDYYHNYASTHLFNTLRLAGNDGNGMSILRYNMPVVINLFGLYFLAIIIYPVITAKRKKPQTLMLALLIVLEVVLGTLHVLAVNTTLGAKIFQSQFVVSTIRDPTKIFEAILPVFVLAFAIGLHEIVRHRKPMLRHATYGLTLLVIVLYGWPILTGNLGILAFQNKTIDDYAIDPKTKIAVEREKGNTQRAIIIPSVHRDELNYQSVSPSLNTLRIGGTLPNTGAMVQELQATIDASNERYFRGILELSGINSIYQKKDQGAYKRQAFGLIHGSHDSYQKTYELLNKALGSPQDIPNYHHYKTSARALVYSPTSLASVDKKTTIHQLMPLLSDKVTVLQSDKTGQSALTDTYEIKNTLNNGERIAHGKAQLFSTNIVKLRYSLKDMGGTRLLQIQKVDPLTNVPEVLIERPTDPAHTQLIIDDRAYELTPDEATISIAPGVHKIRLGKQVPVSIASQDPSFETNKFIGDAAKSRPGAADIYSQLSSDATDQKKSLLIGSKAHLAMHSKALPTAEPGIYKVTFDYKYRTGLAPSFGLFIGDRLLDNSLTRLDDQGQAWKTQSLLFTSSEIENRPSTLNFYIDAKDNQNSESLFDNLRFYKVETTQPEDLKIEHYEPDYPLKDYVHTNTINTEKNYIREGSFEGPTLNGNSGDASSNQPGEPKIKANRSKDATDGKHSLLLESGNHTAYFRLRMDSFHPHKVYKLSFNYKHISGKQPGFTLMQEGINRPLIYRSLKSMNAWEQYSYTFIPEQGTKNISLYLYSPSQNEKTANLFDDIRITEQPMVTHYLSQTKQATTQATPIVRSFRRLSPTKFSVTMKAGTGTIVLNESYHTGWRAYFAKVDDKTSKLTAGDKPPGISLGGDRHYMANGFANAWIVNNDDIPKHVIDQNGEYQLILEYWPERQYLRTMAASITTGGFCAAFLMHAKWRERTKRYWRGPWRASA